MAAVLPSSTDRGRTQRSRGCLAGTLLLASLVLLPGGSLAQEGVPLDSLLRANAYPLQVTADGLTGPGADFLLELADSLQFVAIGESHNISEIPRFTGALLRSLRRRAGFRYVAFENGPVIMRMLVEAARKGGEDAAMELAGRYPHGMQFWTDEEVGLAARAVELADRRDSSAAADSAPVPAWGLDQAWGGLHILERLEELAPTRAARDVVTRIAGEVRPIESERVGWGAAERWIDTGEAAAAIEALRTAFDTSVDPEAGRLIETLALSNRIYRMRGGPGTFRSNDLRERTMKRIFMERYGEAVAAGDSLPRAIARFGHWHAGRGTSPGDVYSLGNFLSELAIANGMQSFHISVALLGDVWTLEDYPEYGPLPQVGLDTGGPDGWTIVDLRPLRPYLATGRLPGISEELRELVLRYDAELLVGGANRATRRRLLGLRPGG